MGIERILTYIEELELAKGSQVITKSEETPLVYLSESKEYGYKALLLRDKLRQMYPEAVIEIRLCRYAKLAEQLHKLGGVLVS